MFQSRILQGWLIYPCHRCVLCLDYAPTLIQSLISELDLIMVGVPDLQGRGTHAAVRRLKPMEDLQVFYYWQKG